MDPARATEMAIGLVVVLQTIEFLALRPAMSEHGVWAFSLQRADLAPVQNLFAFLSRDKVHLAHLLLRLAAATALIVWGSSLGLSLFLFVSMLVLVVRWRGAFNGGSDFMTLVLLTGLLIANGFGWPAGLFYIAIQAGASYFVSGWIKLLNRDWRSGRALPLFLDVGLHGPLPSDSLYRRRIFAMIVSWIFILWEVSIPIVLLDPRLMLAFCAAGVVFHFLVFWHLGLNRFFFAWISTYPALLYLADHLAEISFAA